ncbi:RNA polymerase sigma-70 factor [Sphingobacterium sp. CZ-2]|uniref:RNA polymerase sigma-70 factor n=1 Tax=Sphingobacterium sp. CZ-2 TaxID=2557994 RepID=UPI00106FA84A|nr:RNA polymerase sigma-70 factor [Sphingobacterium sp. CZ-2]QBR12257.1 RNA polymerase sigma-70 factor [Sphingobacterium sp. CZ-2]
MTEKEESISSNTGETTFESFFYQYHTLLYIYALNHLKDEDIAADVVQEVFIKIWNNFDQLDFENNPKAYLFTICKNQVHDELKKKAKFQVYASNQLKVNSNFCNNNEEEQEYRELKRIYSEAIEQLPEKRKHIFWLSRMENLSNTQIAQHLNLSINTVRDQLVKGNKTIKTYILKKHGPIPKKIFLISIVFSLSMSVYNTEEHLKTAWTRKDLNIYIPSTFKTIAQKMS